MAGKEMNPGRFTGQRSGIPSTCARKHRSDRPKANHARTIKLDHSMGADQLPHNEFRLAPDRRAGTQYRTSGSVMIVFNEMVDQRYASELKKSSVSTT